MNDSQIPMESPVEPALAGEEHVRLVTGFADLFAAIVLATGFFAIAGLAGASLGPLAGFAVAAVAWGLGGPLVRRRRFAACGIVLALGFAIGVQATLAALLGIVGMILGAVATWQYWRVYKVPIAAAAAILTPVAVTGGMGTHFVFGLAPMSWARPGGGTALFWGIIVFAIAMYWDMSDRSRRTRRSDVGFWLHLAAAPLIVHGAFAAMGLSLSYIASGHLQPVLILFALLAIVALIVDRRPILVSSLSYLVYAMSSVIDRDDRLGGAMTVAMVLGGGVLVLAVGWNVLRRALLRLVPTNLGERLPPVGDSRPLPRPETPLSEKEPLKLIFGFNDIFVAIGLFALILGSILFSLWYFAVPAEAGRPLRRVFDPLLDWRLVMPPAVTIWIAAEYFVRYRRMALPSLQLALGFAIAAGFAGFFLARAQLGTETPAFAWYGIGPARAALAYPALLQATLAGALLAAGANALFWWRHKVPISVALALASLLAPAFVDLWMGRAVSPPAAGGWAALAWQYRALLAGAIFFGIAMAFDRSDVARRTQRSDIAFWIHLTASLLALPALFSLVERLPAGVWLIAAVFVLLVLLAVVIDRRAPVLVALPFVITSYGAFGERRAVATLIVCALLVATTVGWDRLRGFLLRSMPST